MVMRVRTLLLGGRGGVVVVVVSAMVVVVVVAGLVVVVVIGSVSVGVIGIVSVVVVWLTRALEAGPRQENIDIVSTTSAIRSPERTTLAKDFGPLVGPFGSISDLPKTTSVRP